MSVKLERRAIPLIAAIPAVAVVFGGSVIEWAVDTLYSLGLTTDDVVKLTAVVWCSTVAGGMALMHRHNKLKEAARKAKAEHNQ